MVAKTDISFSLQGTFSESNCSSFNDRFTCIVSIVVIRTKWMVYPEMGNPWEEKKKYMAYLNFIKYHQRYHSSTIHVYFLIHFQQIHS